MRRPREGKGCEIGGREAEKRDMTKCWKLVGRIKAVFMNREW